MPKENRTPDPTIITKGKTTCELKDKDCPPGSLVKLCFSSDFFIEEADEWRGGCWDFIRRRRDCIFVTTTKRPERIKDCVPPDWGDGWEHVHISISIENQEMADKYKRNKNPQQHWLLRIFM